MSKTIIVDNDVHESLSALRRHQGESFSEVLRRHLRRPAHSARSSGQSLTNCEQALPSELNPLILSQLLRAESRSAVAQSSGTGRSRRFAE